MTTLPSDLRLSECTRGSAFFLTDSERNRRDAQKERPRNLIISVFSKFSKHYHEHEDWYYLLGLVLSIAGIAVSFR